MGESVRRITHGGERYDYGAVLGKWSNPSGLSSDYGRHLTGCIAQISIDFSLSSAKSLRVSETDEDPAARVFRLFLGD
jgi:hypothetical protein